MTARRPRQPVVKCLGGDGNVTYQNAPCEKGQAARPMELPKAETRDDTSAWVTAAQDGQVLRGMPKRWVLRSRGAPAEIRAGGPREGATEVWRYAGKEGGQTLVGFQGEEVAWVRGDARAAEPAGARAQRCRGRPNVPPPDAVAERQRAGESTRGPQNRRFVIAGRYCEHVLAEIGAADREEALAAAPGIPAGGQAPVLRARAGRCVDAHRVQLHRRARGRRRAHARALTCADGYFAASACACSSLTVLL